MTPEFWAIIGVGVALGTLTLNGHRRIHARLDRDIGSLEARIERDIGGLNGRIERDIGGLGGRMDRLGNRLDRLDNRLDRLEKRLDRVDAGVAELRERMAYVEGVLEGLRDALVGRGVPVPPKPRRAGG